MSRSVLLVDDEEDVRFPLRRFLVSRGLEVREAENVETALEAFKRNRPDAAVVTAANRPGGGATFTVGLPVAAGDRSDA